MDYRPPHSLAVPASPLSFLWRDTGLQASPNTWTYFRKVVALEAQALPKQAFFAADPTARLWINGHLVIERTLRFVTPHIPIECVPLEPYLRAGQNVIVILHHWWGVPTFQRSPGGVPGIFFQFAEPGSTGIADTDASGATVASVSDNNATGFDTAIASHNKATRANTADGSHNSATRADPADTSHNNAAAVTGAGGWQWRDADEYTPHPHQTLGHDGSRRIRFPVLLDQHKVAKNLHTPEGDGRTWQAAAYVTSAAWSKPLLKETPPLRSESALPLRRVASGSICRSALATTQPHEVGRRIRESRHIAQPDEAKPNNRADAAAKTQTAAFDDAAAFDSTASFSHPFSPNTFLTLDFGKPVHGFLSLDIEAHTDDVALEIGYGELATDPRNNSALLSANGHFDPEFTCGSPFGDRILLRKGRQTVSLPDERTWRWLLIHCLPSAKSDARSSITAAPATKSDALSSGNAVQSAEPKAQSTKNGDAQPAEKSENGTQADSAQTEQRIQPAGQDNAVTATAAAAPSPFALLHGIHCQTSQHPVCICGSFRIADDVNAKADAVPANNCSDNQGVPARPTTKAVTAANAISVWPQPGQQLDALVRLCLEHAQITMSDAYVDTTGREDAQWLEDIQYRARLAASWFGDSTLRQVTLRHAVEQQDPHSGLFRVFAPEDYDRNGCQLLDWGMAWIGLLYDDWQWTGSTERIRRYYPALKKFTDSLNYLTNNEGLLTGWRCLADNHGSERLDHSGGPTAQDGCESIPNTWYYGYLRQAAQMARAINREADASAFEQRAARVLAGFRRFHTTVRAGGQALPTVAEVWTPHTGPHGYGQAAVVNAVFHGLIADTACARQMLLAAFPGTNGIPDAGSSFKRWNTPTTIYRVLRVLCEHGLGHVASAHLLATYGPSLPDGPLPEYFLPGKGQPVDPTGSHGWAAVPLAWLHDTVLGVQYEHADANAQTRIRVRPHDVGWQNVSGTVATPAGPVTITIDWQGPHVAIQAPDGVDVVKEIPDTAALNVTTSEKPPLATTVPLQAVSPSALPS